MKKLLLTLTALSTFVFFSCASKPTDVETPQAPQEEELSAIEEPEVTDLPPEEETVEESSEASLENVSDNEVSEENGVELLTPDEIDELPKLDEEASDFASGNDGDTLDSDSQKTDSNINTDTVSDSTASAAEKTDSSNEAGADVLAADEGVKQNNEDVQASENESADEAEDIDAENSAEDETANNTQSFTTSRSVKLKVSEYLDVTYPGKGWIYMGATDNSKNITYFGRQLGTENTNFSLQARLPGTKILHFYKNDTVSGQIIDDYIEVIVQTERGSNQTHIQAPEFKMPVRAKKPVKKAETTVEYDDSNDDVELLEEPKPVSTSSQKTENGISTAKTSQGTVPAAAEKPQVAEGTPSVSEVKSEVDLSALLSLAKTQLEEKKYSEALKNVKEYLSGSSDNRDEALYVQGLILEAKSDIQNINGAINSYTTLTKNYPASKFWDKANKRIIYLQRFYLQGR